MMLNIDKQEARAFLEEAEDELTTRAPSYIPAGIHLPVRRRRGYKNTCSHPFGVFDRQFAERASKDVRESLRVEAIYLETLDNDDESYDPEDDMIDEIDTRFDHWDSAEPLHDYKVVRVVRRDGLWGYPIVSAELRVVHPVPEPADPEERREARSIRPPAFQSVQDKPKYTSNRVRGRKPVRFVRERIAAALV